MTGIDLRAYRAVLGSRVRSQASYRFSFGLDLASSLLIGFIELAEVWILFHNVTELGGLRFGAMLVVFGLADLGFSMADLVVGHCDRLPTYLRAGTLDVFYLRPQPLLAQLITSDISLRRLARAVVGVGALTAGLAVGDIAWSPAAVALLAVALLSGFVIFCALFVAAGGLQFFVVNGPEMTNAFVYGGRYAATQPAVVWPLALRGIFGLVFPVVFAGYLPALSVLDRTGTAGLPGWIGWASPLAALWTVALAGLCWRAGVKHYQGGGG